MVSGHNPASIQQVLDTDTFGQTLVNSTKHCNAGSYADATSPLCVACPGGFTSSVGATSAAQCYCPADNYLDVASSQCVACPGGTTSPAGATNASKCFCPAGVFTNCRLNELLVERAPHSIYVGEAWDGSGTLYDLSGNGRHPVYTDLTVAPSPGRQRLG
jgi:hypothetical protein